jgi:hypothetical protein
MKRPLVFLHEPGQNQFTARQNAGFWNSLKRNSILILVELFKNLSF